MIRLLISGVCGKMGREIAALAQSDARFSVECGVDPRAGEFSFPVFCDISYCPVCDCVLDFSSPTALDGILQYAKQTNTPLVLGTTGYRETQLEKLRLAARVIPIFQSANLSMGMQKMCELTKELAALPFEEYDAEIIETHHREKQDAPSGTALLLLNAIRSARDGAPFRAVFSRERSLSPRLLGDVGISSVRAGHIFGEHEVLFASDDELLTVRHTALSRRCFARGALCAAGMLIGKPPGLYTSFESL